MATDLLGIKAYGVLYTGESRHRTSSTIGSLPVPVGLWCPVNRQIHCHPYRYCINSGDRSTSRCVMLTAFDSPAVYRSATYPQNPRDITRPEGARASHHALNLSGVLSKLQEQLLTQQPAMNLQKKFPWTHPR
jgi:hypothetical protein